jgi:hypothetical protein
MTKLSEIVGFADRDLPTILLIESTSSVGVGLGNGSGRENAATDSAIAQLGIAQLQRAKSVLLKVIPFLIHK